MFEAKFAQATLLKKILDATKDLVSKEGANWECSSKGISCQAMDNAHVTLTSLLLRSDGFEKYRCDRNVSLGINFESLSKIIKCAGNDDEVTLRANDNSDTIDFVFESPKSDKVSEFSLKLTDIDCEHLSIPDSEYSCILKLPSGEFMRICRDLSQISDSVQVICTKDGVKFATNGDIGSGSITLTQNCNADKEEDSVSVNTTEPVDMTFSLRYLNFFAKSASLSSVVTISLHAESPMCVDYEIADTGYIRFYLAPKVDHDE